MNIISLSLAYLNARKVSTLLNILLLAFGVATITIIFLIATQIEERLTRDGQGIDLVVGAKGSPLQLILSTIYHIDIPTGNIKIEEAEKIERHPFIAKTIPLALGDNYRGFRIVGTEPSYIDHYNGTLLAGRLWETEYEVVLGYDAARQTGLRLNSQFVGVHGFTEYGHVHDDEIYTVTGVLNRTNTVLDKLILTDDHTVIDIHRGYDEATGQKENIIQTPDYFYEEGEAHCHCYAITAENPIPENDTYEIKELLDGTYRCKCHTHEGGDAEHDHGHHHHHPDDEITALLIQYKQAGAPSLFFPEMINRQTNMQAANPAYEITRLLQTLGFGLDILRVFAAILIGAALLGIFASLYNAMRERRYDIAIMRSLGAKQSTLFKQTLCEGLILTSIGLIVGLALGHYTLHALGEYANTGQQNPGFRGDIWYPQQYILIAIVLFAGIVAALLPARIAYNTDVSKVLSQK